MTRTLSLTALTMLGALAGCAGASHAPKLGKVEATKPWGTIATDDDRSRLRRWHDAWDTAVPRVKAAGEGGALDAEGALFQPDVAMRDPVPPTGTYRCRVFKLGAVGVAVHQFTAYTARPCTISLQDGATHVRIDGTAQRPEGTLYADTPSRGVFIGTMMFADEGKALDYGLDVKRNMIGYIERIGAKRWRLVFPWPHYESQLDVIEMVPGT
jgi:hypothetical protein